jgi:hypothetical protein
MRAVSAWLVGLGGVLVAAQALAVLQPTPGGATIPEMNTGIATCTNNNVQVCLDVAEGSVGQIDAEVDALVAPETFKPACALTFTPIVKGGLDALAFGYYNVKPDPNDATKTLKPLATELYAMMAFPNQFRTNAELATVTPATLDLVGEAAAGRYLGGEVGFWLANSLGTTLTIDPETKLLTGGTPPHIYYTEHAFNPGSGASQTYYQVLTWQSVALENAFYFGWEDQPANGDSDNDFDDLLFQVTGIQCTGGGEACETGEDGVCADGTMMCQRGALSCVPNLAPSDEACNALDDDCNGEIDEGELCAADEVCDRGRCVPKCSGGEFRCLGGEVCTELGLCVEEACAELVCPAGQVCSGGTCIEACAGVTCPHGLICRNDACVDPCSNVTCEEGSSCVLGICQSCECSTCEGSLVCQDNVCVDPACSGVTCEAGSHCEGGACVDDCMGAVCPGGTVCSAGQCVDGDSPAGGAGAVESDGGIVIGSGGSSGNGSGATSSEGASGSDRRAVGENDGCACGVVRSPSASFFGTLFALLASAWFLGRRRKPR